MLGLLGGSANGFLSSQTIQNSISAILSKSISDKTIGTTKLAYFGVCALAWVPELLAAAHSSFSTPVQKRRHTVPSEISQNKSELKLSAFTSRLSRAFHRTIFSSRTANIALLDELYPDGLKRITNWLCLAQTGFWKVGEITYFEWPLSGNPFVRDFKVWTICVWEDPEAVFNWHFKFFDTEQEAKAWKVLNSL